MPRLTDSPHGGRILDTLDDLAQFGTCRPQGLPGSPGRDFERALAVQLEMWFPWLGTDEEAESGADVIATLCEIHADLSREDEEEEED